MHRYNHGFCGGAVHLPESCPVSIKSVVQPSSTIRRMFPVPLLQSCGACHVTQLQVSHRQAVVGSIIYVRVLLVNILPKFCDVFLACSEYDTNMAMRQDKNYAAN